MFKLKKISLLNLMQWSYLAFIFCVPFQIQLLLFNVNSYEAGFFNPFTSSFLYLGDLFLFSSLLFLGINLMMAKIKLKILSSRQKQVNFLLVLFLVLLELSFFFAKNMQVSFWAYLRIIEFFLFYLSYQWGVCDFDKIQKVFLYTVVIQSVLAIAQYLLQSNLFFSFLGEPSLNGDIPGLAKINYAEGILVRPYGTFVHPNVLAAYALFAFFFSLFFWKKNPVFYTIVGVLFFIVIILAFSRSVWLAFAFTLLFYFSATNKKIPVLYLVLGVSTLLLMVVLFNIWMPLQDLLLNRAGFWERVSLIQTAKDILIHNPFGIGLGNFTLEMQNFLTNKIAPWDLQPVHNVYLLIATEAGFVVLFVFLLLLIQIFRNVYYLYSNFKKRLFAGFVISLWSSILVLAFFDHYLWTLYQGQFLFWFFLIIVSAYLEVESSTTQI